jgi:hypothetical protein
MNIAGGKNYGRNSHEEVKDDKGRRKKGVKEARRRSVEKKREVVEKK